MIARTSPATSRGVSAQDGQLVAGAGPKRWMIEVRERRPLGPTNDRRLEPVSASDPPGVP